MAQSLPATGGRARRIPVTYQRHYWHQNTADLHAATPPVIVSLAGAAASAIGPQGVGERWDVQLVQVSTSSGLAKVTQAQVWLAVAGQTIHLLMQTTNGGNDDLGVICPTISAGEQIAVIWSGGKPGDTAQAILRGTKHVLEAG
jgi:hypothetical protein